MTANTDVHTCSYYCERPECVRRQRDELRDRLAAAPAAPPSATVGVEGYLVERLGGEGYGNTRSIIDAAFYDPTKPAFWSSPEAQARHRVTPLVPALAQQPAAPEGCGACGDGCANRSGGCRLAEENPPAAPSGEAVAQYAETPGEEGRRLAQDECIGLSDLYGTVSYENLEGERFDRLVAAFRDERWGGSSALAAQQQGGA